MSEGRPVESVTPGVVFRVDEGDYESVAKHRWSIASNRYLTAHVVVDGKARTVTLHRFLGGPAPSGMEWDHINRDRLDNRRANLRLLTKAQNRQSQNKHHPPGREVTSNHRGVYWSSKRQKWVAQARVEGRNQFLGHFDLEQTAALVAQEFRRIHTPHAETTYAE